MIQLADSTLVPGLGLLPGGDPLLPGDPSIIVTAPGTSLVLNRAISGPIAADPSGTTRICASIIDATSPFYVAYAGPDLASAGADLHVEDSTVIGKVRTRTMTLASNTIFHARRAPPRPLAGGGLGQPQASRLRPLLPAALRTRSRRAATTACPLTRHPSPHWNPSFVTLRYGQPRLCAAQRRLADGDLDTAPTTARRSASTSRSRRPRRSATSSCGRPSTCPPSSKAASSCTHRSRGANTGRRHSPTATDVLGRDDPADLTGDPTRTSPESARTDLAAPGERNGKGRGMKGDFSRIRFNRRKNYTAVLEQQGRVALDADANEQCFIDEYLRRSETVDVVGDYGGPASDAGFEITVVRRRDPHRARALLRRRPAVRQPGQPVLRQPAVPDRSRAQRRDLLTELANANGADVLQVFLEVWQRLVTDLDDPCLREPALGQADTTARLQTVWRGRGGHDLSSHTEPRTPAHRRRARLGPRE